MTKAWEGLNFGLPLDQWPMYILKLILRGKRLGYALDKIAKMIGLADVDINEIDQIRHALTFGAKKLEEIRHPMKELKSMEQDMARVRQRLMDRLETMEKGENDV